jgi:hypothetical protein
VQRARGNFAAVLPVARIASLLGYRTHKGVLNLKREALKLRILTLVEPYSKPMRRAASYRVDLARADAFVSVLADSDQKASSVPAIQAPSSVPLASRNTSNQMLSVPPASTGSAALSAVLRLAARGLRLFPCVKGRKVPSIRDWPGKATSDAKQLVSWHEKYPGCNWATATGNGLFVLDIDGAEGMFSASRLRSEYGYVKTLATRTGNGWHMFFTSPEGVTVRNSVRGIADGLDIRGDGGYVVVPPSRHPDGPAYAWVGDEDEEIADAPAWLLELITSAPKPPATVADYASTEVRMSAGGRS